MIPFSIEEQTFPVLDPEAPCAWCGSSDRPRVQRGPSELGWQCADADACKAEWVRQHSQAVKPARWLANRTVKDLTGSVAL